jgi:predicted permease
MSPQFVLQVFLPTLVPLAAGWLLARFVRTPAEPLADLARYVLFPVLLFVTFLGPMKPESLLVLGSIGAAMALAAFGVLALAGRYLHLDIRAPAAMPNVACFALPFLALSWDAKDSGLRAAAAIFVGAALTLALYQAREGGLRQIVKEPWIWALAAAITVSAFGLPTKQIVHALTPLTRAAMPLFLVLLGASLYPLHGFADRSAWATVAARLVVGLAVGAAAVKLFSLPRGVVEATIVVALAPPTSSDLAMTEGTSTEGRAPMVVGVPVSLAAMVALLVIDW